jgi:hypothetical protein
METLGIVILSILAFYGLFLITLDLLKLKKFSPQNGFRLILQVPPKSEDMLEGIVRSIFLEEIPSRLMSDPRLYLMLSEETPELSHIIRSLSEQYPVEVLPDDDRYCMITDRSKDQTSQNG